MSVRKGIPHTLSIFLNSISFQGKYRKGYSYAYTCTLHKDKDKNVLGLTVSSLHARSFP
jgi:hypothetical protein